MKLSLLVLATGLLCAGTVFAAESSSPKAPSTASVEAQKKTYPLDTCVVSGEKLGEMGKPIDYVYKVEGQPDRLVRFCCKQCVGRFEKNPQKYLAEIDQAAKETAKK